MNENNPEINKTTYHHLFANVKQILKSKDELERAKGEKFNVFSILKMENKENTLHSAFLAELLNPLGSHLMGTTYLSLFLKQLAIENLNLNQTKVYTEHSIGKINNENQTGGRIDILLTDEERYISIENKIYADDQPNQIERYCNFKKNCNTVFYLTLKGKEPERFSKNELTVNKDFYLLSYGDEILSWLEACLKESAESPIARESIKQYIIIIKKLTGKMDTKHKKELQMLIASNLEEAKYIGTAYESVIYDKGVFIRRQIHQKLKDRLPDCIVKKGNKIKSRYAQIWIYPKLYPKNDLFFGVETFNGGEIFIGIFKNNRQNNEEINKVEGMVSDNSYWANKKYVSDFDGQKIDITNPETIKRLYHEDAFQEGFIDHIVREVVEYTKEKLPLIDEYYQKLVPTDTQSE